MKSIEKLLHLIDHLGFIRSVNVMICIGDTHYCGTWNASAKHFSPRIALRRIGGKACRSALWVVRKEMAPIVGAGEDREYWNGD